MLGFQLHLNGVLLFGLTACSSPQSYDERIDAFNAASETAYEACFAKLDTKDGYSSMHGDGRCFYSNQAEDKDGKTCKASFRRKITFPGGRLSCEPYHKVQDSNGTLMIEERHHGQSHQVKAVRRRDLQEQEHWIGDLWCRSPDKQTSYQDIVFKPYELKRDNRKRIHPRWSDFGWMGKFPDGQTINLADLRSFNGHRVCTIIWRYEIDVGRYKMILSRLGYR